jgi:hypothetical protein
MGDLILHADRSMEFRGEPPTQEEAARAEESFMRFVRALARLQATRDYEAEVRRLRLAASGLAENPD